jgi:hypothetical protein
MESKRTIDILATIIIIGLIFYMSGSSLHYGLFSGIPISYEFKFASTFIACLITMIITFKEAFTAENDKTVFKMITRDIINFTKKTITKLTQ